MIERKDSSGEMKCPFCSSMDVFWNGSQCDTEATLYIPEMYCEDCDRAFGAMYKLLYTEGESDD